MVLKRAALLFFAMLTFVLGYSQNQDCLEVDIQAVNGNKGDEICLAVKFYNFDSITSLQFSINYDPTVLKPTQVTNINQNVVGLNYSNINIDTIRRAIRFTWSDPNITGVSLQDGVIMFEICFKLIGAPGDCSNVTIGNIPSVIETYKMTNGVDSVHCLIDRNLADLVKIQVPTDLCVLSSSCSGNTGSITIKAWGGKAPYLVDLINPAKSDVIQKGGDCVIFNNLPAGNYQVRVTDANMRDTLLNILIASSPSIVIGDDINPFRQTRAPKCWNTQDGRIGITASGGVPPLLVAWKPVGIYGETYIKDLGIGTYTVCITDSLGCTATKDFKFVLDSIVANLNIDKLESCAGNDGQITIKATGGNPFPGNKYNFFWSQNVGDNCVMADSCINDGLGGKQFVIIEDSRGCRRIQFFEILNSGKFLDSVIIDSVNCKGGNDGSFHAFIYSATSLNLPLTYQLFNHLTNTPIAGGTTNPTDFISPNLPAGSYRLEVTDALNCKLIDTIDIFEPQKLDLLVNAIDTTESCNPGADAFINVRAVDGTPGYSYLWSNSSMANQINNLTQGVYTVTITDANGCTTSQSFNVSKPVAPQITGFNNQDVSCPSDKSGCVEVLFTPGSSAVNQFNWNIPGNSARICNLGVGNYQVTITDVNGCQDTASTLIKALSQGIIIDSFVIKNPSCPGRKDGFIIVFPKGGTNYRYAWDNGVSQQINANIGAGSYIVAVSDIGTCPPALDTFILTEPPHTQINLLSTTTPSCTNQTVCDGQAIVLASGIDTSYTILWSSGEQSLMRQDTATMLCEGINRVIVTNGICNDTLDFDLKGPIPISIDTPLLRINPPTCYGFTNGSITLLAKGGTSPYQYNWTNSMTGPTLSNVGDGWYYCNIIDSKKCLHFDSVRVRQPDSVKVNIISASSSDISCFGMKDGKIVSSWNGGNGGPGRFSWIPNVGQDSILTNLSAGTYRLIVSDSKNCTGEISYTINQPSKIVGTSTAIDTPKCDGDQIDFSVLMARGGTGVNYRFTINDGAPNLIGEQVPLFPGVYKIKIYDENNCFTDTTIVIPDPLNNLRVNFVRDQEIIQLGDSVRLDGRVNSSSILDTIIWTPINNVKDPANTSSYVDPAKTTTYVLTVIDENGCLASDAVQVIVESKRQFYVPNAMSPNDDGINDYFTINAGPGVAQVNFVSIFDRWGELLYSVNNPDIRSGEVNVWKGDFKGSKVNPGVYVYVAEVKFKDGFVVTYRGDITVLR